MAHSRDLRGRARALYIKGWSYRQIAEDLEVGKTTLLRWCDQEGWDELRAQDRAIERESRALLLRMLGAAQESGDAQATYAAVKAAKLAGIELGAPEPTGPSPKECAVIFIDTLARHPDIGPVVRKYRNEVIRLFLQDVERMEPRVAEPAR